MKNKIEDLRNHLFVAIEKLHEADDPVELQKEIDRSRAIADIGKVLVESAKAEVEFVRATKGEVITTEFFNEGTEAPKTLKD